MPDHQKRGNSDDNNPQATHPKPGNEENTPVASDHDGAHTESLASRIQKSASGLARNAFLSSAPTGDAAQLLSDGSKATPSSSSSSALAAAAQYRETSGPASSSSRDQSGQGYSETFRSSVTTQPGGFELPGLSEKEFQSTYREDFTNVLNDTSKGKGKGKETINASSTADHYLDPTPTLLPTDGDAVVSLLTDTNFDPEFPPSADEPTEFVETELQLSQLTPDEIKMIESFRRQLPLELQAQQNPGSSTQLSSLSLVPAIGSFLETIPMSNATTSHATSLRDEVLTSLPGAADWIAVEEKYHDEVWGYLQPTLEAAAKEIESRKESASTEDGPAVRRLKMILKHMQH
ncbi:hypothetical protein ASPCAL11556 [Aspergillus calidoustus]|uniref:Uncharacterized protein n=1 Tax=Aspergillus calidoustus TaxID=454130 RepID=A0A0U5G9E3_ASPCI|nr:hypothetical protein ASPCAL11556 [Aspergillus calidoustus]